VYKKKVKKSDQDFDGCSHRRAGTCRAVRFIQHDRTPDSRATHTRNVQLWILKPKRRGGGLCIAAPSNQRR